MKFIPTLLITLSAACTLASQSASAAGALSGPGMMRCSVVLKRLSSAEEADRQPVLSWAQGYLSGIASVASALDGTSDIEVPAYDELQPRLLALCKAEPSADLYHVARRLSAGRARP